MLDNGLLREVYNVYRLLLDEGSTIDGTTGISQAIGFKELIPYIDSADSACCRGNAAILNNCIQNIKVATRQYARKQLRWIRNKILSRGLPVFQLDTSDESRWDNIVLQRANDIFVQFLTSKNSMSKFAASHIHKPWHKYTCDVCPGRILNGEHEWLIHLSTKGHKLWLRRKKITS